MKKIQWMFLSLVLLLAGCPQGGPKDISQFFTEDKAWKDDIPADAEVVSPEDFKKGIDSGEYVLVSAATLEAQRQERETTYDQNVNFLKGLTSKDPVTTELLEEAANVPDFQADRSVTLPGGQKVIVEGLGTQLSNLQEIHTVAQSSENALEDYTHTYALLPEDLKSQAATPESLKGKSLEDIRAALSNLNTLLGTMSSSELDGVRLDTSFLQPQAVNPGNGTDNNGVCNPNNLFKTYWFPLKNFISPVKNQANRGVCWAFTAIGALESRERVQNNNPANLSEQFLVNKVKEDWDSDDDTDGYWSERALELAVDEGQVFPSEAGWTYNPSMSRPNDSYANSCNNYTGDCSDTAHQSKRVCTTFVFTFCSYQTVTYSGAGVAANRTIQLWKNGQGFDLNRYRLLLSQGYVIMASFPVYTGFMDRATGGFVTDYSQTRLDDAGKEVAGSYGGHAVQIVGFLSNDELSTINKPSNVGGGGYFIIKNSWGCNAGDGGYYYVPADYISRLFNSLSYLNFDLRRSDAWNREQANPGSTETPRIEIKTNPASVDLRVVKDLAGFFKISHSVAKSVTLIASSSIEGTIYNGVWSTDTGALFGSSLNYTFASEGRRTITLTARYAGNESKATFNIDVVNTAPTLELKFSGDPRQSEAYPITAVILDKNEADTNKLCTNTTWSVDAPDTLSSATGCQQSVTFGTTGSRQVRVSTRDTEGRTATQTLTFNVLPPPENPYPRIVSYGVYSREFRKIGNFFFCSDVAVPSGNTIDFREKGCNDLISVPDPARYSAAVEVENPSGETLTYDWKTYVQDISGEILINRVDGSSSASFEPYSPGNAIDVTADCRITVQVNAPEASRSKSLTVWTGKCIYYATRLN